MVVVVVVGDVWGFPAGLEEDRCSRDPEFGHGIALPQKVSHDSATPEPPTPTPPHPGSIAPPCVCVHKLADDELDKKERRFFPKRAVIVQDFASIPAITQMFCRKQPRNIANSALITVFRAHFLYCSN